MSYTCPTCAQTFTLTGDNPTHRPECFAPKVDPAAYADLKRREVEALHRYGERMFGDAWWPGQTREGYAPEDVEVLDELGYFEEKR